MRITGKLVSAFLFCLPVWGQGPSYQTRQIFHPTITISKSKSAFLTIWSITNLRSQLADNTNLLIGLGVRRKNWWLETMVQRQWSRAGNQLMLDVRYQAQLTSRLTLYAEGAPFLNRRIWYDLVFVEYRIGKRVGVGGEIEDWRRPGRDSLGGGPRGSYVYHQGERWKAVVVGAWQFRNDLSAFRVYNIISFSF